MKRLGNVRQIRDLDGALGTVPMDGSESPLFPENYGGSDELEQEPMPLLEAP